MPLVHMHTVLHHGIVTALMLVAAFCAATALLHGGTSRRQPCLCAPLLIQGRITAVEGRTLTIKPPDAYPGTEGGTHAHFVISAPPMRVDVSRAGILFADGRGKDDRAFAIGEHVVVALDNPRSASSSPGKMPNPNQLVFACVIERIETGDKIITH